MNYQMLIDGQLRTSNRMIDVINPANEEIFARVPHGTKDHLDEAVAAAKNAQRDWARTTMAERRVKLEELATAMQDNAEEFTRLLTQEQGKPLVDAEREVGRFITYLTHTATLELPDRTIQDDEHFLIKTLHRPLGVVGAIVAWNFPLLFAGWKMGPALMAGNAIVLKPAPTTPVATLRLGELCADIFPPGLVNIITDANDLGPLMSTHPDIAKIGFTGSTATGKRIMASAADSMKRLTLEMGGNDPAIILPDVDIPATAAKVYAGALSNAGQICIAVKRVYVHESIHDAFCTELAKLAATTVVGNGMEDGITMGPIQNKQQYKKILGYLKGAAQDGNIIAGGDVPEGPGYFVTPTIVRDVTDGNRIVDEEQFGPILPVVSYSDIEEVIDRVNASPYGLAGSVHGRDLEKAMEIAERIESGTMWVNQQLNIGPHIPMAGFKSSGLGVEQSVEGLAEYTQIQVLNVAKN